MAFLKLTRGMVDVKPLDRSNWEEFASMQPKEEQRDFMPSVLESIAQSKFEPCTPLGIWFEGIPAGFAMFCEFNGVFWISRILVDRTRQEQGIGRTTLQLLIEHLHKLPTCKELRTSLSVKNSVAEYLFMSCGFRRVAEPVDGEVVMRYVY
jgi:diamine N-acetyltransferase